MKQILLVVSHLGANSSKLCETLQRHRYINWIQDTIIYDHPAKINFTKNSGIYINEVLYNYQIQHKGIYGMCDFFYLINHPRNLSENLVSYYVFRLRRIYEMAAETKGIFLTWDELESKKGLQLLQNRLGLVKNIDLDKMSRGNFRSQIAEEAYERCIYRLNAFGLERG